MAYDFPGSPIEGQEFTPSNGPTYVWYNPRWMIKDANYVKVSDTPPANPTLGSEWWESDTGRMWLWYDDGDSKQWVQTNAWTGSITDPYPFYSADVSLRSSGVGNIGINSKADGSGGEFITIGGNTGAITALGTINGNKLQSNTHFESLAASTYLGAVGSVHLRPNGIASAVGQLYVDSTGLVVPSAGIQFPSAQISSANVNTFDDYEEGVWTPGIAFAGASVGVTYGAGRQGVYTKIGRTVICGFEIPLTAKGTSVGGATITGLPFVGTAWGSAIVTYYTAFATLPGPIVGGYVSNGVSTATIVHHSTATGIAGTTDVFFTATSRIIGSIVYTAAT